MIVDSSVIVGILRSELDADELKDSLRSADSLKMSTATYVEVAAVVDKLRGSILSRRFDDFVRAYRIELIPVSVAQAYIAREAYRDFGKGSGHPARLNFGDCFAYALAKELDEPLLFKGNDFSHTDVSRAR